MSEMVGYSVCKGAISSSFERMPRTKKILQDCYRRQVAPPPELVNVLSSLRIIKILTAEYGVRVVGQAIYDYISETS